MSSATPKARGAVHVDHLSVVRAFACFCVLTQHVAYGVPAAALSLLFGPVNLSFIVTGCDRPGVYLFFVLSGYLMGKGFRTNRYASGNPLEFYFRRALRIIPAYAVFLAFTLPYGVALGYFKPANIAALLRQLSTFTYNPANGLPGELIGHLWTVSTEMQFYVFVPLFAFVLTLFCARLRPPAVLALISLMLIGGFAQRYYLATNPNGIPGNWAVYLWSNLDIFVSGMLLNFVRLPAFRGRYVRWLGLFFGLIAAMYLACSYAVFETLMGRPVMGFATVSIWYDFGVPALSAAFALVVVFFGEYLNQHREIPARFLRPLGILTYGGTITYSFYLWHGIFLDRFQTALANTAHPLLNDLEFFFAVALSTGAVAALSHTLIERPFYRIPYPWNHPPSAASELPRS